MYPGWSILFNQRFSQEKLQFLQMSSVNIQPKLYGMALWRWTMPYWWKSSGQFGAKSKLSRLDPFKLLRILGQNTSRGTKWKTWHRLNFGKIIKIPFPIFSSAQQVSAGAARYNPLFCCFCCCCTFTQRLYWVLWTYWGHIRDALGRLWGCIWDTLGTHQRRSIEDALGTHWRHTWDALGTQ